MSYFLVRPDVGRYQPWSAEIYLRSQVARDHAVTHTFSYLSMPLQATNWVPVICGWLRRAFSRPARLRRARSPVRTSPLASELPLTCSAVLLTNQCLPVPDAARPPEGHWRAHPAAAPCRPHAPRRGIGVRIRQRHLAARTPHGGALACAPGSGALPAHVNGGFTFPVHRELLGTTCRESAPPSVSVSRHGRRFRSAARR